MTKPIFTKEMYKKFKRMNRQEMEIFICNIYKNAYDDGYADTSVMSSVALDLDKLYDKLLEIKGIGSVKANQIISTIKTFIESQKCAREIRRGIDGLGFIYHAWQNGTSWFLAPDKDGVTTVLIVGNIYENESGVKVKKYRKKPIVVEAIQYDKALIGKAQDFCDKMRYNPHNNEYYIETLEGTMLITEGDYIIKDVNGEFYPCKADIFEKTYEEVL